MDEKKARYTFAMKYPDLDIKQVMEYDETHWVIEAYHEIGKPEMDPFYYVDKRTGKTGRVYPMANFKKFMAMLERYS